MNFELNWLNVFPLSTRERKSKYASQAGLQYTIFQPFLWSHLLYLEKSRENMPYSQAFDLWCFLVLHTTLFENETEESDFILNLSNNELKTMIQPNALPKKNSLVT